ncbi:S8 family serine peptidase [Neolewinella persica]|uniref:S8 family serine peptidase n=1 Tax=Neolewinella persica TaxID=70998 RepID=UPI00035FB755|nr:S8 family serine peptidase [Neolewinella persica]
MFYRLLVITLLLTVFIPLSAQRLDYRQGELIVQFGADVDAKAWITAKSEITEWKPLGQALNAYLISFDFSLHGEEQLRQQYWQDPAVAAVQLNHLVALRARPNDTRYDDQWQHLNTGQLNGVIGADHNVEPAWDITTGGVTVNGDTIVVAVLDDGIDVDHEDIVANLWRNRDEIPNNGIDDDNNGYVDDYHGWNTSSREAGDGNVEADDEADHGTPVAGIVGAVGNNNLGVTGVNWSVKLMIVKNNFNSSEAEVLEAYSFPLEQRQRYDETNGVEGAYVVATSSSWGRNFGQVDDSPIWCSLYDRLGAAGILNAGATANLNIDVEEEGDLPSNCTSPFLVTVTNLNTFDVKVRGAAFGNKSIDLGAYGEDVFTTSIGNNYGPFGGTSAATPSVAGAIALLYSAPCEAFGQLLAADPAAAALRVRAAILDGVRPNASLAGITVTGGRLDVAAALDELQAGLSTNNMASCDLCLAPTFFNALSTEGSATSIIVDWRAIEALGAITLSYRPAGSTEWTAVANAQAPYEVSGLATCVAYDFQLTGNCGDGPVTSELITVSTDGCCVIPDDFSVAATQNQVFIASWTGLLAGRSYRVRYRKLGDSTWLTRTSISGSLGIAGGIDPCTNYEFEFQTNCDTLVTDFGNRLTVLSTGCGACLERDYCTPDEYDNDLEWIAHVNVGNILVNASGPEPNGYRNFGEVTTRPFVRGGEYPIELTPDFNVGTGVEGFRVYVDWNQDGILSSTEVAAEMDSGPGESAKAVLTVPEDAALLLTRMRVIVQFRGVSASCSPASAMGEVEDYCINIIDADPACPPPTRLDASYDEMTEQTLLSWRASAAVGGSYRLRYRLQNTQDAWTEVNVNDIYLTLNDINLCGTYDVEIASVCGGTPGEFRNFIFNDQCTGTRNNQLPASAWKVFPNPAAGQTTVSWSPNLRAAALQLFDVHGRVVNEIPAAGNAPATVDLSGLAAGVYLLRLRTADGQTGGRRVVVR